MPNASALLPQAAAGHSGRLRHVIGLGGCLRCHAAAPLSGGPALEMALETACVPASPATTSTGYRD